MVREDKSTWKANYFIKIIELFDEYPKCFVVNVDNVGSKQMQEIRQSMRGDAVILMGKNTMIRKAIKGHLSKNPALEKLLPFIVNNVGFVFTKSDLSDIRGKLLENRRGAPAKAGAVAPCDVKLPPQNTGMGPEKTSFFQALQIPTKITKGTIEILNEVHLIKVGDKVGASEAALLNMLNLQPFSYGLIVEQSFQRATKYQSYRMLIYKDVFQGDELASDSFPMKLVDGIIYEFKGKHVVRKEGDIVLAGSNPSAEGEDGDDGSDEHVERGIDFVLNHKLVKMDVYAEAGAFKTYVKGFMKKVLDRMQKEGKSQEEIDDWKKKVQAWVVGLLAKDRFKNLDFYVGERAAESGEEGTVAIVEYREVDGEESPYLLLVKEATEVEKC